MLTRERPAFLHRRRPSSPPHTTGPRPLALPRSLHKAQTTIATHLHPDAACREEPSSYLVMPPAALGLYDLVRCLPVSRMSLRVPSLYDRHEIAATKQPPPLPLSSLSQPDPSSCSSGSPTQPVSSSRGPAGRKAKATPAEGPAQASGAGPRGLPRGSPQSRRGGFRCVGLGEVSNT